MIKFSALQVEDGRAFHHPNVGAIAIENIAAHDRSPSEAPGPSCACWTRIARQFGRHAGPACHLQALFESGAQVTQGPGCRSSGLRLPVQSALTTTHFTVN